MPYYKYLIVGGGMAADGAVNGIREIDQSGSIGIIGSEISPPYKRPPLTKGLWTGKKTEDSIWLRTSDRGAMLHLNNRAIRLDPGSKTVTDDRGTDYTFDKLLLATGGTPRRLPFESEQIIYYRTFDDYLRLRKLIGQGGTFAVIGGGFIGSEIAAALAMVGKKATMIFPDPAIGSRIYPRDLASFIVDYYRDKGVEVLPGETVASVEENDGKVEVRFGSGRVFAADGVVAGIGIDPNVELAQGAGLEVENGIVVDQFLRTRRPDIYAAGDVAAFHNPALDKRLRVEHEDNALTMGRYAGRGMVARGEPYDYLPYFYSDLFELGYEAVGELDSRLETFADWKEPFREGVVYYLREGRVRGALLWNVWDRVPAARELIAEPGPFSTADLKGRITN